MGLAFLKINTKMFLSLFDRFFRGTSGSQDSEGSGLGLSIVRAIADKHDAQVRLGSKEDDRGLSVSVVFQAAQAEKRN